MLWLEHISPEQLQMGIAVCSLLTVMLLIVTLHKDKQNPEIYTEETDWHRQNGERRVWENFSGGRCFAV